MLCITTHDLQLGRNNNYKKRTSPEGQQLRVSHQFLDHPKTDDILGFTFLLKFFMFIQHKWMKIQDKTLNSTRTYYKTNQVYWLNDRKSYQWTWKSMLQLVSVLQVNYFPLPGLLNELQTKRGTGKYTSYMYMTHILPNNAPNVFSTEKVINLQAKGHIMFSIQSIENSFIISSISFLFTWYCPETFLFSVRNVWCFTYRGTIFPISSCHAWLASRSLNRKVSR